MISVNKGGCGGKVTSNSTNSLRYMNEEEFCLIPTKFNHSELKERYTNTCVTNYTDFDKYSNLQHCLINHAEKLELVSTDFTKLMNDAEQVLE